MADFLGAANLMEVEVVSVGALRVGDFALTSHRCEAAPGHRARGDQARAGADRGAWFGREDPVLAMVERVVFLGSATEILLRLAPGIQVQALMQNDGSRPDLAQGTPVNVYLPPDALRVLAGSAGEVPIAEDEHLVAS